MRIELNIGDRVCIPDSSNLKSFDFTNCSHLIKKPGVVLSKSESSYCVYYSDIKEQWHVSRWNLIKLISCKDIDDYLKAIL